MTNDYDKLFEEAKKLAEEELNSKNDDMSKIVASLIDLEKVLRTPGAEKSADDRVKQLNEFLEKLSIPK